jgi:hypothetical protein
MTALKVRLSAAIGALVLAIAAPAAHGATTIGQIGTPLDSPCSSGFDFLQSTASAGAQYVVPPAQGPQVLTSWSTRAGPNAGQRVSLKVFHPNGGLSFRAVTRDQPRTLAPSTVNTFQTSIPVQPGDALGLHTITSDDGCFFTTAVDTHFVRAGDLADGSSDTFTQVVTTERLDVQAVVKPSNDFSLGALVRNKKTGAATLAVNVSNAGTVSVSGRGVRAKSRDAAVPGGLTLKVIPIGNARKRLGSKGKARLTLAVTFSPAGGDSASKSESVTLKKKRKPVH